MVFTFNCRQGNSNMIDIYKHINDIDISMGETKRMNCPVCNGYKTFTITNNMGQKLWNCYKASCSVGGSMKVILSVDEIKQKYVGDNAVTDTFTFPEYIVDFKQEVIDFIVPKKYQDIYAQFCMHDIREDRAVFKIFNDDGVVVDAIGRSIFDRFPKWKRYGKSKYPFMRGLYNATTSEKNTSCVLVEDCISACVVSNYGIAGIALLGTSLLDEHKSIISKHFDKVVVALDPDALPKTLQIAKELKGWVKDVKVLKLTDDLKYSKKKDIANLKEMIWN